MTGPSMRESGRVGVRVMPLTSGFAAELKRYLDEAERELKLQIPASLDTSQARDDLRRLQAELDGTAVQIGAGLNAADARAELDRLRASIDGTKGDVKVGIDRAKADSDVSAVRSGLSALASIAKTIVIGAGFAAAAAGLATAVVQGVALATALASAAGAAALIPAAVAALGAVVGTALIGLSGIGDALKAQNKASTAAGGGAGGNPNAAIDSARQVAAAQRGLQAAYRNTADQRVQDARRIVDAEQAIKDAQASGGDTHASDLQAITDAETSYTRAQRDELRAQTDLNAARAQAAQQLADLKVQLSGAAVDQEQAALDLAKAQKTLADTQANDFSTGLERQAAQVAVDQAAQKVAAAAQNYTDLKDKSDQANAAGVDGAANVISAQDRLTDAIQSTRDAQNGLAAARRQLAKDDLASTRAIAKAEQDLADARHQQAKDQLDAANTIADAQDRLAQASESAATKAGGGAAGIAAATAMAKLSPLGRQLVTTLLALGPAWDSVRFAVQDRLLEGVSGRITTLAGRALPVLRVGLVGIAGSLNTAAKGALDFTSRAGTLQAVSVIFLDIHRTIDALLPALHPLYQAMLLVTQVGAGFGPGLAAGFAGFLTTVANGISRAARDGDLQRFIANAILVVKQLAQIAINVGQILFSVFTAGQDSGGRLLAWIVAITGRLADLARSTQGQNALRAGFDAAESAVRTVIGVLRQAGPYVEGFFRQLKGSSGVSSNFDSIRQSLTTLGPILASAFKQGAVSTFSDGVSVAATVLHFLADHAGTLAKLMPLLVAGYVAFKAAQAASNLTSLAELPIRAALIASNFTLAAANRALATQMAIANGEEEVGILTKIRSAVVTAASTVATWAASAAAKAWAAAQWLLNAAMDANPVVLIVIGILALVAAFILAYQHSETFRKIVQAALGAVVIAARVVIDVFTKDIPAAFLAVVRFVVGLPDRLAAAGRRLWSWITAYLNLEWTGLKIIWNAVIGFVTGIPGRVAAGGRKLWSWITDFLRLEENGLKVIWSRILGVVTGLGARVRNAASGMWDGIKDAFRAAINWLIDHWNGLQFKIPSVDTHIPGVGKVGGFILGTPDIPRIGQGATVLPSEGGTLAVLAERGKSETVVDTGLLNKQLDLTNRLAEKVLAAAEQASRGDINNTFYVTDQDPTLLAAVVNRKQAEAVT